MFAVARRMLLVAGLALALAAPARAAVPLTTIGVDPFTNADSQHATAVEPDTLSNGSTIVSAFQVGRYFDGGASGVGFATSTNNGATWTSGTIPGLTKHNNPAIPFDRVTDPAVAFDPEHNVWMVSSLLLTESPGGPLGSRVVVSRSTDGGLNWSAPVTVAAAGTGQDFDKNWTTCDTTPTSPHFGNCYTVWDDFGNGNLLLTSTSTDGGLTWGAPLPTANNATGLGGQPLVQADGDVIVPAGNASLTAIIAYRSTNGGASWSSTVAVSPAPTHTVAGNVRSDALPTAEIDAAGKVYVVWQDCRFRKGCKSNDLVMTTSTDGVTWTAVQRIPIDSATSGADHFIPGLGVDRSTSGSSAKLGLGYYFYRAAKCRRACDLEGGFISSSDGGATWGTPVNVAGPFATTSIADTSQGRMVGDYISTSWAGGTAHPVYSVALSAPSGGVFNQPAVTPTTGLTASSGTPATSKGANALENANPRSRVRRR